ncbi:MAG TPA: DUF1801 domain-containing protein [Thermoanaerobaculales bacterium]|nr:DUF1801 domain-containing protein [Thermoanaerobaculales bacterium]
MAGTSKKKASTTKNAATGRTAKRSAEVARKAAARPVAATAAKPPRSTGAAASGHTSASRRIDTLIADLGDWRGERLAEIRALIHEVDPEVVEEWKWMGTPVWSHGGMFVLANAHKAKVKLTFCHGAGLPDPTKLFNAGVGGNRWRAIDLREGDTIDRPAFKALLRAAIAYNAAHAVPKLLSGGNPQIAKADGDAPVQAYIAAMPGWKRDVGRRLDALITRSVPGVRKAVRWNSPFFGIEGQGWFLSFHCFTAYVRVAFFRGASLRPVPPGESKQEDVRYLDIHEDDRLDEVLLAGWVRQASRLPGWGKA